MADGISALGTAVGVTSLGIQVCQALVRYYSDFRDFDGDIAAVITRAEGLEASLEALESIRPNIEVANSHVSKQLQQAVETCSKGLIDLKTMVEECGKVGLPASAQAKRRLGKKRLLWPFRVETVTKLRGALDELQSNVLLAVQILELDTGRRRLDTVYSNANALTIHNNKLEHSLLEQTRTLETVHKNISHVKSGQEREISQISQMSLQLANIEHQLTSLIARDVPPKPTSLALMEEQPDDMVSHSLAMRPTRHGPRKWCTCRVRKDVICWSKFGDSFSMKTVQETEHQLDCKFSKHGQSSYKFQAQFSRCTNLFGLCIQAGIVVRKISGWTSISPIISARRLVSKTSPAFAVFYHVRCMLKCQESHYDSEPYCSCGTRDIAPTILANTWSLIRRSIEEGRASQHDTLINGDSILHIAVDMVLHMFRLGHIDIPMAWEFLHNFISAGIFDHVTDDLASTLAERFIQRSSDHRSWNSHASIASHLITEFGSWSYNASIVNPWSSVLMWQLLTNKDVADLYEYQCPLMFAISRRSKADLIRELSVHEATTTTGNSVCQKTDVCRNTSHIILESIHWPEGLQILLSSNFTKNDISVHKWNLDKYDAFLSALHMVPIDDGVESLDLLGHFGWPVYPAVWFLDITYGSDTASQFLPKLPGAMLKWKVLQLTTGPMKVPDFLDCELASHMYGIPTRSLWNLNLDNLYHSPGLSVTLANALWETGFKEFDNPGYFFDWACDVSSTPLWIQASQIDRDRMDQSLNEWEMIEWLVEKGARLDWIEPNDRTTTAHRIGLMAATQMGFETLENEQVEATAARVLATILPMEHLDECFCHCSQEGCFVIGCAARGLYNDTSMSFEDRIIFNSIAKALDSTCGQSSSIGLAVIRVFTFEELSLTHTCCTPLRRPRSDDHDRETRETHEIERQDIEVLEKLMAEFEQTWKEHRGTFQEYLDSIWKVRIEELRNSQAELHDIECIQSVGITLQPPLQQHWLPEHGGSGLCHSFYVDWDRCVRCCHFTA